MTCGSVAKNIGHRCEIGYWVGKREIRIKDEETCDEIWSNKTQSVHQ